MAMPWEMEWGGQSQTPVVPSVGEMTDYMRQAASQRGFNPDETVRAFQHEGLQPNVWQSRVPRRGMGSHGGYEDSWGPTQLYMGGGLGNEFQQATGLDPRDPSSWKAQVDFSLDHIAKNQGSLKEWYGPQRAGINRLSRADLDKLGPGLGAMGAKLPWDMQWAQPAPEAPQQLPEAGQPVPKGGAPTQAEMAPNVGEDVVRSGATGVQRGLTGLLGTPGDVRSLAAGAFENATGLELPNMPSWVPANIGPIPLGGKTTPELQAGLERAGMPVHEPQTVAGEYARTVGEFAPAAIGGAGGLLRRGAQAVIPALVSETAGQAARQVAPEYEDAARIGTALATGGVASRPGASKLPRGAAPSTEEIGDMAHIAYDRAEKAGLRIKGDSFRQMVGGLIPALKQEGIDPSIHTKATAAARRLINAVPAPKGPPAMAPLTGVQPAVPNVNLTLQEFDTLRRVVRAAAKSTEPDERRIASIMTDHMDDYFGSLKAKDIAAGDLRLAHSSIKEARSLWQRMRKSEMIDDILEVAKDRAGQFSVSGNENAIRTGFRQLSVRMTKDKRARNLFTPEEQKLIRELSRGWTIRNGLRLLGKLAPRSQLMLGAGAGAGTYWLSSGDTAPVAGAAATYGLGTAAHLMALGLTKRKVGQLTNRVRSGGAALVPGAPASPALIPLAGQAASVPWRTDQ